MFLLHDLLVKAGQVNFFHIAHVEHVSALEKKCNTKKKRLLKEASDKKSLKMSVDDVLLTLKMRGDRRHIGLASE